MSKTLTPKDCLDRLQELDIKHADLVRQLQEIAAERNKLMAQLQAWHAVSEDK